MPFMSRRKILYSLGILGLGLSVGKVRSKEIIEKSQTRALMGTFVSISARNENSDLIDEAIEHTFSEISKAEALYTRHNTSSPLGVLNTQGSTKDVPPALISLLVNSLALAKVTRSAFNPAIAPVLQAYASYNVKKFSALPTQVQSDLKILCNPMHIKIENNSIRLEHSGMALSLDGIAKGHIADIAAMQMHKFGIYDYSINAGGDIRLSANQTDGWNIAIQDAQKSSKYERNLTLKNVAIATSGNYESLLARGYEHLVTKNDNEILSVTVLAQTCKEADSLATALFAMDIKNGKNFIEKNSTTSALWQTKNGIITSSNWNSVA